MAEYGKYHPEAASYTPYQQEMAAWRNEVVSHRGVSDLTNPAEGNPLPPMERTALQDKDFVSTPPEEYTILYPPGASSDVGGVVSCTSFDNGFFEEDEEPEKVQEAFEEGEKGLTAPPVSQAVTELTSQPFDPSEHNAPIVIDYLERAREDEVVRVLDAEESGKARKGILKLSDDLIERARTRA